MLLGVPDVLCPEWRRELLWWVISRPLFSLLIVRKYLHGSANADGLLGLALRRGKMRLVCGRLRLYQGGWRMD